MAIDVILHDIVISEVLFIVTNLRSEGLVQGIDFDFAYNPPKWDYFGGDDQKRFTVFTFYNEHRGMLFKLQHG